MGFEVRIISEEPHTHKDNIDYGTIVSVRETGLLLDNRYKLVNVVDNLYNKIPLEGDKAIASDQIIQIMIISKDQKTDKHLIIGKNPTLGQFLSLGDEPPEAKTLLQIGDNAIIRSHTVIYRGTIIGDKFKTGHGVLIRELNEIGNNVSIGSHTVIEKNNIIKDNVRIHSMCFIPEYVTIEKNVWISPHVTIANILHPPCPRYEDCASGVIIEENAKIGANATILPHVNIGKNSLIGAGAVVTSDIPADSVAYGNPAKVMGDIKELKCEMGFYFFPYEWEGVK